MKLDPKEVEKLYKSGLTMKQISKQFNCSTYLVFKCMKENGIESRPVGQRQTQLPIEQIIMLYESGLTIYEVSDIVKSDPSYLAKILKGRGVKMRSKGRIKGKRYAKIRADQMPVCEAKLIINKNLGVCRNV